MVFTTALCTSAIIVYHIKLQWLLASPPAFPPSATTVCLTKQPGRSAEEFGTTVQYTTVQYLKTAKSGLPGLYSAALRLQSVRSFSLFILCMVHTGHYSTVAVVEQKLSYSAANHRYSRTLTTSCYIQGSECTMATTLFRADQRPAQLDTRYQILYTVHLTPHVM